MPISRLLVALTAAFSLTVGLVVPVRAQATLADLYSAKAALVSPSSALQPALKQLLSDAREALKQKPLSVLDKKEGLPGVDPHAYVSYAPYFWPDPKKSDGLPFIRHDGKRNAAQVAKGDANNAGVIKRAVCTLILADCFTPHPEYVEHAARLLRVWFLDPKTRMLPHVDYGQAVPGGPTGRKEGVLEWRDLTQLVLCLELLEKSPVWSADDRAGMRAWLTEYYGWLTTSKLGIQEKKAGNNHGSWWDVQAIALALFLDKPDDARKLAEGAKKSRIAAQIEPDGRQPRELGRADSWGYSTFNLLALCTLADYAKRVGVDLWGYKSDDGRSIRGALDYLLRFADGTTSWPHENDPSHPVDASKLVVPLLRAATAYHAPELAQRAQHFSKTDFAALRERLLLPPFP